MHTEKYVSEEGEFRGFGFPNTLLGKNGTLDVIKSLPGVDILHFDKHIFTEKFCTFRIRGETFQVSEPFGDNSYYDIFSDKPNSTTLHEIHKAFEELELPLKRHRKYFVVLAFVVAATVVVWRLISNAT